MNITTSGSANWHGLPGEWERLVRAAERNCSCLTTVTGIRISTCSLHHLLEEDQRALDGLLFTRRIAAQLVREEFTEDGSAEDGSVASVAWWWQ